MVSKKASDGYCNGEPLFSGVDDGLKSVNYNLDVYSVTAEEKIPRRCGVHTLHHGSVNIAVTDWRCEDCGKLKK